MERKIPKPNLESVIFSKGFKIQIQFKKFKFQILFKKWKKTKMTVHFILWHWNNNHKIKDIHIFQFQSAWTGI